MDDKGTPWVAFRKEGVDWNCGGYEKHLRTRESPSARKVWIEMQDGYTRCTASGVAFRKEGVDWNARIFLSFPEPAGRLPQGRCGLKFYFLRYGSTRYSRLPQGRCGLKCPLWSESGITATSPSARKVRIKILTYFSRHFTSPSLHIPCWQRTSLSQGI